MKPPESQTNQPDIDRAIYKHALFKLSLSWKRISSATDQVQGAVARKFTYSGKLGFVMSAHEFGRGKLSEEYTASFLPKYTSKAKLSGGIIQLRKDTSREVRWNSVLTKNRSENLGCLSKIVRLPWTNEQAIVWYFQCFGWFLLFK